MVSPTNGHAPELASPTNGHALGLVSTINGHAPGLVSTINGHAPGLVSTINGHAPGMISPTNGPAPGLVSPTNGPTPGLVSPTNGPASGLVSPTTGPTPGLVSPTKGPAPGPTNSQATECFTDTNCRDHSEPPMTSHDGKGWNTQADESQPPPLPVSNLSPYAPEFIPRGYRHQPQAPQSSQGKSLLDYIRSQQHIKLDPHRRYSVLSYQSKGTVHYCYQPKP